MYCEKDLVIIIPVVRRPHRAALVLGSARAATPGARVLFVGTRGDAAEHEAVQAAGGELLILNGEWRSGDYARKVNLAYRSTSEPLLFLGADDIEFDREWFPRAIAHLRDGIEVVGTNDLGNKRVIAGVHSTHTLVTRRYVDEFGTIDQVGYVLHEGYHHEFVDDEFIETAKFRGMFSHATDSIVRHLHPAWGLAPMDELYAAQVSRMRYGRMIYNSRRYKWQVN